MATKRVTRSSRSSPLLLPDEENDRILARKIPEPFHLPDLKDLPTRFRMLLTDPTFDPYTVIRENNGAARIECGMCGKKFEKLRGWQIHAREIHRADGFCERCGRYVKLPYHYNAEQCQAMMELHAIEWCPKPSTATLKQRETERQRLQILGRGDFAQHLYIPAPTQ